MNKILVPKRILPFLLFVCSTIVCNAQNKINDLVTAKIFNYPVLKGKKDNPVLRIEISGNQGKGVVNALKVDLKSTSFSDLNNIGIYYTGQDSLFSNKVPFGNSIKPTK